MAMIEEVLCNDYDISETFHCFFFFFFFANIVPNLKIIPKKNFETAIEYEMENLVQNAINNFKNHPSIKLIISKINPNKRFSFCPVKINLSFIISSIKTSTNA